MKGVGILSLEKTSGVLSHMREIMLYISVSMIALSWSGNFVNLKFNYKWE